ncbi:MAG TPA: hypothetical protein VL633_06360 [Bacteroidota bacterium]|jgi:hypothetical protein|nr:hypothetical protein [Bacteroidota bacterium]
MHRLAAYILFCFLAHQAGFSQPEPDNNYLYGYKTLFFSVGATSQGRFLALGYMANRYVFEFEAGVEPRRIRFGIDSLVLHPQNTLKNFLGGGQSDSNILQYTGTMRAFYRDKFKFLGALCELNTGLNFKSWIAQNGNSRSDTITIPQNVSGTLQTTTLVYHYDQTMDFSAGPSLKLKVSSGRDRGEPVLSLVFTGDVNYYLTNKVPTVSFSVGIMIAPFSYR